MATPTGELGVQNFLRWFLGHGFAKEVQFRDVESRHIEVPQPGDFQERLAWEIINHKTESAPISHLPYMEMATEQDEVTF
jgi:hypothetical protein